MKAEGRRRRTENFLKTIISLIWIMIIMKTFIVNEELSIA